MIGAGQFNVSCAGDMFGEVSRVIDRYHRVAGPVQDKARHADGGEDRPNVYLAIHARQGNGSARTRALALEARPDAAKAVVR